MNFTTMICHPWQLWKNAWPIAATWVILLTLGMAWVMTTPSVYRSEGKLFVRLGRENVTLDPTANLGDGAISSIPLTREAEINSIVELLRTQDLLQQVVDDVGADEILQDQRGWSDGLLPQTIPERDRAVAKLSKLLEVAALRKSNLVKITFDAHNPELAHRLAECYIERFLEYYRGLSRNAGTHQFFEEQAKRSCQQLQFAEEELLKLKNTASTASVDQQQRLLLTHRDELSKELETTQVDIVSTRAAIGALKTRLARFPENLQYERTTGLPNAAADSMRDQLYTLQLEEKELSAKYTEQHVLLQDKRKQIAEARELHAAEREPRTQIVEGRSKLLEEMEISLTRKETELDSYLAREAARRPQLADLNARLIELNQTADKVNRIERDIALNREAYLKYAASLEQARIDESLRVERIGNIALAQSPSTNWRPISPNRSMLAGMMLIVATFAAVGFGIVAQYGPQLRTWPNLATQGN